MLLFRLLLSVQSAFALEDRSVGLTTGIRISISQAVSNVTGFAVASAAGVCALFFLLGAGQLVISAGDENKKGAAKTMMVSSLIGLAIIVSAYGIIRTVLFFLYEGS